MSTETVNAAAERLEAGMPKPLHPILHEALAFERRATVERLRVVVDEVLGKGVPELRRALDWHLDIEADR